MTMCRRILIVGGNDEDLGFYSDLFQSCDCEYAYEVVRTDKATTAMAHLKDTKIDCVFVDFDVPDTNGLIMIDMIKSQFPKKDIPIVMLINTPHLSIQAEAARQGAYNYIAKRDIHSGETLDRIVSKAMAWSNPF